MQVYGAPLRGSGFTISLFISLLAAGDAPGYRTQQKIVALMGLCSLQSRDTLCCDLLLMVPNCVGEIINIVATAYLMTNV